MAIAALKIVAGGVLAPLAFATHQSARTTMDGLQGEEARRHGQTP
jgi:hypothetical protein